MIRVSHSFSAVLLEHGYRSVEPERRIIEAAGGRFIDGDPLSLEGALTVAETADAVMLRRIPITREVIRRFRNCRIIMRYGVGIDNVDLATATEQGIIVSHVPVYCQDEVSTHAIALLLACIRRVTATNDQLRHGAWNVHGGDPLLRVAGKTLGLVGLGTLGQAVARKFQGWGMRILATDPYLDAATAEALNVQLVPLGFLLREADFVSLHVPLLPETTHLINDATLGLMKHGSILVNTSRGPVVSASALLRALDSGHLAHAALDVFESEPPPADDAVRRHPRLIITDHVAWYSEESQLELQRRAAEEVVRCCTGGLPEAIANPEVLVKLRRAHEWTPNHLARWQTRRAQILSRKFADESAD